MRNFKAGWLKDKPDGRDFEYRIWKQVLPAVLPFKVDLRDKCSEVEDQLDLGSCTANALAGAVEFVDLLNPGFQEVSRLFLYYNIRKRIGTVDYDSGGYLRDGAKSLADEGACSEKDWPYITSRFTILPSHKCYEDARNHQVTHYFRLKSLYEMKSCLAEGFPFVFGFMVYPSCLTSKVAATGEIPFPSWWDKLRGAVGGHAIASVGYNDSMIVGRHKGAFLIRNSWGTEWGNAGYGWLPYNYIKKNLADDFWTIRKIEEEEYDH